MLKIFPKERNKWIILEIYAAIYTVHGILQDRILEWVAFPFFRDLPNPGIKPKSHTLQADSLPAEPQGKPIFLRGGKGSSGKFETSWQEK